MSRDTTKMDKVEGRYDKYGLKLIKSFEDAVRCYCRENAIQIKLSHEKIGEFSAEVREDPPIRVKKQWLVQRTRLPSSLSLSLSPSLLKKL